MIKNTLKFPDKYKRAYDTRTGKEKSKALCTFEMANGFEGSALKFDVKFNSTSMMNSLRIFQERLSM